MTKIPLTVSLPPDVYDVIDRLATLQGSSKSSVLVRYLTSSLPSMIKQASVLDHLNSLSTQERLAVEEELIRNDLLEEEIARLTNLLEIQKGLHND